MGQDQASRDELHDPALGEEIELVGDLVVAATSAPGRLPPAEIDRILGVPGASEPSAGEPGEDSGDPGPGAEAPDPAADSEVGEER